MNRTVELTANAPVRASVDVLVVGAGPAGLAAAIASARHGASTLLVERYGYVGGNLTAGLVGPCMTSYSLDGKQQLIKGIFDELVVRMEEQGFAIHPSRIPAGSAYTSFIVYGHDKVTPFEPEGVKAIGTEMCIEAGVELLFHSTVVQTLLDGDRVTGVVIASKSGLEVIEASVVVDCSADADVAARAGVEMKTGRDKDGLTQPMTLFFRVGNVDDAVVENYIRTHPEQKRPFAAIVEEARKVGEFTIARRGVGMYRSLQAGVWRINTTRIQGLDGTDVADLTRAEIDGHRQVMQLMRFFRKRLPGFENCTLIDTAGTIGVRETRRIVGEYVLTLDDLATGRDFPDTIALCGYPVDIHSPDGNGSGGSGGGVEDVPTANIYQIPYRCLLPVGADQLLVAGRSVSSTHEALGAIRVMPPAFAMGQAAGTAAAMSVAEGVRPRDLDVDRLRAALVVDGVNLGQPVLA